MEEIKNTPTKWVPISHPGPIPRMRRSSLGSPVPFSMLPLMTSGVVWCQLQPCSSLLRVWVIWHVRGAQGLKTRSKPHKVFAQHSVRSHVHPWWSRGKGLGFGGPGELSYRCECGFFKWETNWKKGVGKNRSLFPSCSWYPTERGGSLTRPAFAQVHLGEESLQVGANPCDTSFSSQLLSHWAFSSSSHEGHSLWT